ncbi:hypothetical protein GCM10023116_50380 [Kistimonas scapharcae]|uniref:PelB C-terminal domain-containing protein n=2 Tax=Kistimonas scapharcae TaxID=1036133 RepID=A0ABP8VBI1_9GAMM
MLLALLAWVLFALVMLFQDDRHFEEQFADARADAVSIAYLRQLQRSSPDDWRLRHKLASQLNVTGQYQEAWDTLQSVTLAALSQAQVMQLHLLQVDVAAQWAFAAADPQERERWIDNIRERLRDTPWQGLSIEGLKKLADMAASIGEPGLSADFYQRLARVDARHSRHWLEKAAQWKLAANESGQAGAIYTDMAAAIEEGEACEQCHQVNPGNGRQLLSSEALRRQAWLNAASAFEGQERYVDVYRVMAEAIERQSHDPELLIKGIDIAVAMESYDKGRSWLRQLLSRELSEAQLEKAQVMGTGMGATDLALEAAERRLKLAPDDRNLRRGLAELYEWNGFPAQALEQWLWVNTHEPEDKVALERAWDLAQSLYEYTTVVYLLVNASRQRILDHQELTALLDALESLGLPEAAEDILKKHLNQHPDEQPFWLRLVNLLEDEEKLDELAKTWMDMHEHFPLSQEEFLRFLRTLQALGRLGDAITMLSEHSFRGHEIDENTWFDAHVHTEYEHDHLPLWLLLADLAWAVEDDVVAAQALEKVLAERPGDVINLDRYLALTTVYSPEQRLQQALAGFELTGRTYYAVIAMELAFDLRRWEILAQLVRDAKSAGGLNDQYVYWLSIARLSRQERDIPRAIDAFEQALLLVGHTPDIMETYLWFLISENQREQLERLLGQWYAVARDEPALWPVMAAGSGSIADYRIALFWYKKALQQQPGDVLLQLAYADTLALVGDTARAWSVRRAAVAAIRQEEPWLTEVEWRPRAIQLRVWLNGLANSIQWVGQTGASRPELWMPELTRLLMQAGNLPAAQEWLSHYQQQGGEAPLYQLLSIALQGDREALAPLLAQLGPGPDRVEGLLTSGYASEALAEALQGIDHRYPDNSHPVLTEQAVALTVEAPSGWRVRGLSRSDSSLSSQGYEMTLAQRFDRWHIRLDSEFASYEHDGGVITASLGDQLSHRLQFTRLTEDGFWRGYASVSQREDSDREGGGFSWLKHWDSQTSVRFFGDYRDKTAVTSLMGGLGQESRLGLAVNYQISGSDSLYLKGNVSRFSDRYQGKKLGDGYHFEGRWAHQLFFRDPEWVVSAGMDWHQYSLEQSLGTVLADRLVDGSTPATLLPEQYRYFLVDSRWQHGEPGALNARVPSPRWQFGITAGYQQPEDTVSYNLEAGMGWRLFGNDEFSLTAGYDSAPQGAAGEAGYRFTLGYQYRFGR